MAGPPAGLKHRRRQQHGWRCAAISQAYGPLIAPGSDVQDYIAVLAIRTVAVLIPARGGFVNFYVTGAPGAIREPDDGVEVIGTAAGIALAGRDYQVVFTARKDTPATIGFPVPVNIFFIKGC